MDVVLEFSIHFIHVTSTQHSAAAVQSSSFMEGFVGFLDDELRDWYRILVRLL